MPRAEGKEAEAAEEGGSDEEEVMGGDVSWQDRIEPAIKFFDGKDLNGLLDDFVREHRHEFEEAAEAKTDEEVRRSYSGSRPHRQPHTQLAP